MIGFTLFLALAAFTSRMRPSKRKILSTRARITRNFRYLLIWPFSAISIGEWDRYQIQSVSAIADSMEKNGLIESAEYIRSRLDDDIKMCMVDICKVRLKLEQLVEL